MRIIAGTVGGRRLLAPRGAATRPTADRVREALFNILCAHDLGAASGTVAGTVALKGRVLDLYAGTGALGLEALSRGAASAVFVDEAEEACRVVAANAAALGLTARCRVERDKALHFLRRALVPAGGAFELVLLDPPYAARETGELDKALGLLGERALIAPGGVAVAEHHWRTRTPERAGPLVRRDQRRYGETAVSFYMPEVA
jgi:16S rRNA (guanine966-N2)-methyltransferase